MKHGIDIAIFRCLKCGNKWSCVPEQTNCPVCKNKYVKWENFEEWREKNMEYPYN